MKTTYAETKDIQVLVREAKAGRVEAKTLLCQQFQPLLYSLSQTAYETLDKEDVRQELWISFLEYLASYDETQGLTFLSYITPRMKWRTCDICRKHGQKETHEWLGASSETMDLILSGEVAVEHGDANWYEVDFDARKMKDTLALIQDMPLTKRQKDLLMWNVRGYTWQEVAKITHISPSVVYRHVKKIQRAMAAHPEFFEKISA